MSTNNHQVALSSEIQWLAADGGRLVGFRDRRGTDFVINAAPAPAGLPAQPTGLTSEQVAAAASLVNGSVGLSGATYDGSNKVTGFVVGSVTYTVAYASGSITVTGSDGSSVVVSLDGSGRISGVVVG